VSPVYYDHHHSDDPDICPACSGQIINPGAHAERCTGIHPVRVIAEVIADGGAFRDEDAVRVARAFLEAQT
jgi:hypothetical protein